MAYYAIGVQSRQTCRDRTFIRGELLHGASSFGKWKLKDYAIEGHDTIKDVPTALSDGAPGFR